LPTSIDISSLTFVRLTDNHTILPFDCDDADLNDFLFNDAKNYSKQLMAVTYLIEDIGDNSTIAFFSLFNDTVSIKNLDGDKNLWNRFRRGFPNKKRVSTYPAVKLGRLGVSKQYKGKGYGKAILDYLKIWFVTDNRTGCKYITVDAYSKSLLFYEKNEFKYFTDKDKNLDTRQMYFDLIQMI